MSSFHEVRFPIGISLASKGGPERKTEIVTLRSGYEERNAVWENSRHRYNIGYGIKNLNDIHDVIVFFEARMGRLYGFRFKDPVDYKSCTTLFATTAMDQNIGTGDGSQKTFQLKKKYQSGTYCWTRRITKPVAGTVSVAIDSTVCQENWFVDTTSGAVAFDTAPAQGKAITAGFEYDVPARFDCDLLEISLESFTAGKIPNIPIIEVLL
jgi:uncharacterized protein (TIGR02217 family)